MIVCKGERCSAESQYLIVYSLTLPTVAVDPLPATKVNPQEPLTLSGTVSNVGSSQPVAAHWTQIAGPVQIDLTNPGVVAGGSSALAADSDFGSVRLPLVISPDVFYPGTYTFRLTGENSNGTSYRDVTFEVAMPPAGQTALRPLEVFITGGDRVLGATSVATLDAGYSFDPDSSSDTSPGTVTWSCVGPGGAPCLNRDGTPFVFRNGGDDGAVSTTTASGSVSVASRQQVNLMPGPGPDGWEYTITVTVTKGERSTSATTTLTFVNDTLPEVVLRPLTAAQVQDGIDASRQLSYGGASVRASDLVAGAATSTTPVTAVWTQVSGPTFVNLTDPNVLLTPRTFTGNGSLNAPFSLAPNALLPGGDYVFRITATDRNGTASQDLTLHVAVPPGIGSSLPDLDVVLQGGDRLVSQGTTVTLSGALSYDPAAEIDNQTATYQWSCLGPNGSPCLRPDGTPFTFGGSASGAGSSSGSGSGSGSGTNASGSLTGGTIPGGTGAGSAFQDLNLLGGPAPGIEYQITLTVTKGSRVTSETTTVTVVSGQALPTVNIAPLPVAVIDSTRNYTFPATVTTSNPLVPTTARWTQVSGPTLVDMTNSSVVTSGVEFTGVSPLQTPLAFAADTLQPGGTYVFRLTASTPDGATSYQDVTMTVAQVAQFLNTGFHADGTPYQYIVGTLDVDPPQGSAVITTFNLRAAGWVDTDGPLLYQFAYTLGVRRRQRECMTCLSCCLADNTTLCAAAVSLFCTC